MCGFLGEISVELLKRLEFKKLLDLSVSRGPDQQGFWKDDSCQLGFNRLSILDLSENGKQPLLSPSGNFAMVFNGEVYNYKDIQKKYNIPDAVLRSSSDSEILSHLIEKVSLEQFASELNGMFAISIWDIAQQQLFLIRDFSGIKPLYYGLHDEGIVFASQFDQIFQHMAFHDKKLRPEIMKEFFGLGYMPAPNTVFANIFQVEPGQFLVWDFHSKKIVERKKYYEWKANPEIKETESNTIAQFSEYFKKTIKSQLHADVPVATFLSSGIDSTLVTLYAKENKDDICAFTFGVSDPEFDETSKAKEYAKILAVNHLVESCSSEDLLQSIDIHFQSMPEPFGDYSSIPTYLITKKATQFATVMLSGDGGDELFWGYPRYMKSVAQAHWFKYPLWLRKMIVPVFRKKNKQLSSALDLMARFSDWILYKQIHFTHLDKLFPKTNFSTELQKIYNFKRSNTKENVLLYLKENEFYGHQQRTLRKVDLMSMANSLEVRVPFLDKEMIRFSNTIIPQLGIEHAIPKFILKEDLYCHIDQNMVNKKKKGFSVPIEKWLKNELKEDFIKTVIKIPFYGSESLNSEYLHTLVDDFYQNKTNANPWGMWHLYAWQKWAINHKLI